MWLFSFKGIKSKSPLPISKLIVRLPSEHILQINENHERPADLLYPEEIHAVESPLQVTSLEAWETPAGGALRSH